MANSKDEIGTFEPIAIVGLGAILPDAPDVSTFWKNVISGEVSIRNLPKDRWRSEDHWEAGGPKNISEGKTYSKIGAWVDEYEFDWKSCLLYTSPSPRDDR